MALPSSLEGRLRLPLVCAPMFLVSGPELVIAACRSGVLGTFPALNRRSSEEFADWLACIEEALAGEPDAAPFGVNLIVHRSNRRLEADLGLCVAHRVPLVITSLGAVPDLVREVHAYGGLVFHDVISRRHAEKAAEAGVDGLVLVCGGAGGHAGTLNPFAFLAEARRVFSGTLALAGALSTGADILAAQAMGADLAYMGTRFIATRESRASDAYKRMLREAGAGDIVYTSAVSGIAGSFLRPSLEAAGIDPAASGRGDLAAELERGEVRAWRDIWSAGQGVAAIEDVPPVATLVARLEKEYRAARERLCGAAS
ncbi:MAG TPA: nitronate monooxygenase [Rhodospirillales bacterium]|nr:nitronate monooxygenase [Rhodospirillales bacterium]